MLRHVEVASEEPRLCYSEAAVMDLFAYLDATVGGWRIPAGDLGIRFLDDTACCKLHADFFDDPELTDVMTFPGDPDDEYVGDLAVCPAYAVHSAPAHGLPFAEELTLYLIHGWLHLAGLDDRSDATIAAMRQAETTLMTRLRNDHRVPAFAWRDEDVQV